MGWRRVLVRVALGMLVLFGLLQLVPYGWRHPNPPVTQAAVWPSGEAEALFDAACADCHSNETDWPPYSYVAPMSWLVRRDVERGRDVLNLSELDREQDELDHADDAIEDGSMPPWQYELAHPDADLSAEEQAVLIAAFEQLEETDDDREDERDDEDRSGRSRGRG